MITKYISVLLLLLACVNAAADPGIGIVKDKKGNIYYTDLGQVWKIAPDGRKSVAVAAVHTHQLYIDAQDRLYGEHLWYEGETTDIWRSYYWRLSTGGRLDTIAGPVEGFEADLSLYRDSTGNQYRMVRWKGVTRIKKISPYNTVSIMAEKQLRGAGWMLVTQGGDVYVVDVDDIYRVKQNGEWERLAAGITGKPAASRLDVLGIWPDGNGVMYAADALNGQVKRIGPAGTATVIYTSTDGYRPSAGLWDDTGNLWVLEYNAANAVRVTEAKAADLPLQKKASALRRSWPAVPFIAIGGCIVLALLWRLWRR